MAKFIKCFVVLLLIIGVFGGAMFALNLHTGPIIEQNNAGAANDRLNSVMAGGTGYEDITATLGTLPETVVAVHKEKSGLGFVIEAKATSQYTGGDAMDILIGVSPDGKICGIKLVSHSESLIFGEEYPSTYIGKDSALSGVEVYAGSTFSSKAFKGAVEAALNLLIENNLISAGVKTPEQILTEMIATVAPELADVKKSEGKGDILAAYTSGSNAAYIVADGDNLLLAVIKNGECKIYNVEGNDVTEASAEIIAKVVAYAAGAANDRLNSVMEGATAYENITLTLGTLPETVVAVHKETSGLGFVIEAKATSQYTGGAAMDILIGVSSDGKICGIKLVSHSESLIFGEDYPDSYIGKDSALTGVEVFAGSTYSSNAFKGAVEAALNLLIDNNLISAGVKTPEQILTEMIATVAPELANANKSEGKGDILTVYTSGANAAYLVADGEDLYLAVVIDGACKLYNVDGNDVADAKADVVKKVTDYAASAANERLNEVLPGANGFEDITATLKDLPASVVKVHKEANGLGFVVEIAAIGYNKNAPMDVVMGVNAEGKIVDIKIHAYNDTPSFSIIDKDPTYIPSYIGQDSTLADVGIVAGSTISSTGFKTAIAESLGALVSNELISGGVKSDEQILTEMIAIVAPGYTKLVEVTVGGNVTKAYKSDNGVGFAYIVNSGDANFLAVVNAMGVCKVYNTAGEDVTAESEAVVTEAKAHATANQKSYAADAEKKFNNMFADATEMTAIEVDTFNSIAYAVQFKVGEVTYYGFYSRSVGFHQMDVYVVIDENGAIAKFDAKQLIFEEEYFMAFQGMPAGYKDGFVGVTEDTFDGQYIIASATMTSNAVKQSTEDAFASFNTLNDGGNA